MMRWQCKGKGEFAVDEVETRQSLAQLQEITSQVLHSKMHISTSEISAINTHIEDEYFKTRIQRQKTRGMYAVSPSTKLLYKQTYGDMLSDAQVRL